MSAEIRRFPSPEGGSGERLAITPDGDIKPVSEFTAGEKWWCDGEDCGGCGVPDPHVHPYDSLRLIGGALAVDLLTGREMPGERERRTAW